MSELGPKYGPNRSKLIRDIETMLGGELIDVETGARSYDLAVELALDYYRQRSHNAVEESYLFINLTAKTNDYILPNEVIDVRKVFRKSFGVAAGSDQSVSTIDPFDMAFTNMFYLQDPANGGMATYDLYAQNIETAGRLFGLEYVHNWNETTKRLKLMRYVRADEEVVCWVYNYIPDEQLLTNTFAKPWIRRYALAQSKMMLGQAYAKFGNLAGPQGGISMNGSELKAEAQTELQELEDQLKKYADGGQPLGFIMG